MRESRSNFKNFKYIHDGCSTALAMRKLLLFCAVKATSVVFARINYSIPVVFFTKNALFAVLLLLCLSVCGVSAAFIS